MDQAESPYQLLYDLERSGEVADEIPRLRQFQEMCCQSLTEYLPPDAEQWLRVAQAYRLREATATELEQSRASAWTYIRQISDNVADPRLTAARALVILLYPDDWEYREDEPGRIGRFESLEYFLMYCNRVVDQRAQQTQLLSELFPELAVGPSKPGVAPDPGST